MSATTNLFNSFEVTQLTTSNRILRGLGSVACGVVGASLLALTFTFPPHNIGGPLATSMIGLYSLYGLIVLGGQAYSGVKIQDVK